VHFAAAGAWVALDEIRQPVLSVVAVVWMANLFNFMDGSDGLAISMAFVGFGCFALAIPPGNLQSVLPMAIAMATIPVLLRNWPPASVFIGDVGAVPLGFAAGAIGVGGIAGGAWPTWFPVLVLLPFIADASVTLARRAFAGERVWKPHREHSYQKMVQSGWGHRGTLYAYLAMMLACAGAAFACLRWRPDLGVAALAGAVAAVLLVFALIEYHWRNFRNHKQ
jgi:UDP-N-acetylmuramyl pentapeptide phosphotransferase/UDP-N-acetylglucosamine-1-phosphate transferase